MVDLSAAVFISGSPPAATYHRVNIPRKMHRAPRLKSSWFLQLSTAAVLILVAASPSLGGVNASAKAEENTEQINAAYVVDSGVPASLVGLRDGKASGAGILVRFKQPVVTSAAAATVLTRENLKIGHEFTSVLSRDGAAPVATRRAVASSTDSTPRSADALDRDAFELSHDGRQDRLVALQAAVEERDELRVALGTGSRYQLFELCLYRLRAPRSMAQHRGYVSQVQRLHLLSHRIAALEIERQTLGRFQLIAGEVV